MNKKTYVIPNPIIDSKEEKALEELTERYKKLIEPGKVAKAGKKAKQAISQKIPNSVKALADNAKQAVVEAEVYEKVMKIVADGFETVEKNASKVTISEKNVIAQINETLESNEISYLEEICLARGYNISKAVNKFKLKNLGIAFLEGGGTGAFGFAGIPFNLVLSTFVYYRAVQSVAMFYGYDVKNDASELIIASDVFTNAMSPSSSSHNEVGSTIAKFMVMAETSAIKTTVKKGWEAMASRGGVSLVITQIRALANKAAEKALIKTEKAAIEKHLFKNIFEQLGKRLTQKFVERSMPVIGAGIGALFDTSMMNTIIEYADVFYNKRFLLEKETRIELLTDDESLDNSTDYVDADFVEIDEDFSEETE